MNLLMWSFGNWNLVEINMNKILKLEKRRNCDLMMFIQHKNFFDLFNNSSNGFAISVEVLSNDFSIESTKKLLDLKAVLIQIRSNNDQKVTMLIKDSATGTMEILEHRRHQALDRLLRDITFGRNLFEYEIDDEKFLKHFTSTDYLTLRLVLFRI